MQWSSMTACKAASNCLLQSWADCKVPKSHVQWECTQGEDVGVLARLGSFCELGPGCKDDEGKMAPSQGVAPSSCAHLEPVSGPAEEMVCASLYLTITSSWTLQ